MDAVLLCLIMAAVFIFGFCVVDRFGRYLDEIREENRRPLKKKESH